MTASATGRKPSIYVLAGPNGGGKSSILGEMMVQSGTDFINPDREASRVRRDNAALTTEEANAIAWRFGRDLLEQAVRERLNFAFETTLGGHTIPGLLEYACSVGIEVKVWFVCLATAEMHLQRVRARVAQGGHDIPEAKIRERYDASRANLIRLLPRLTELRLFDNSFETDFRQNAAPKLRLILHFANGRIIAACEPAETPEWARPIVEVAIKLSETAPRRHGK